MAQALYLKLILQNSLRLGRKPQRSRGRRELLLPLVMIRSSLYEILLLEWKLIL
jgi:hypothetical protein